jgi:hypothetical protein
MLPDPPGANQSTCRLCMRILRCSQIWHIEQSNFGAPETAVQIYKRLWEKLRPLQSPAGYFKSSRDCRAALRVSWLRYYHSSCSDITTRVVVLSYSSVTVTRFATSQYGMHYSCISIYIYIRSIWLQVGLEHNRKSTWTQPLSKLRVAPSGGHSGETMELAGREPSITTPLHLSRHPNTIHQSASSWRSIGITFAGLV